MNLPNALTLIRMFLVPLLVAVPAFLVSYTVMLVVLGAVDRSDWAKFKDVAGLNRTSPG